MNKKAIRVEAQKPTSFSLDTVAKAVYIGFSSNSIEKTARKNNSLFIDYDKDGKMVGIEIIRIHKVKAAFKKVQKDIEKTIPDSIRKQISDYLQPLGV